MVLWFLPHAAAWQGSLLEQYVDAQEPDPYGQSGPASPLNVVLIMADDVGVDQVGSYARNYACPSCNPLPAPPPCTPNIDALAARGLRFTNAWSSPVCSPSRAQVLTGKRTSSVGMGRATGPLNGRSGMSIDELTLGDLIPLNGYFGKWHMADSTQIPSHPIDCGFFPFLGTMWNLDPPPRDGPHYYDWRKYDGVSPTVQTFEYATTVTTDDAIAWIDQLNAGEGPWFVMVSYHASHSPYQCPQSASQPNSCNADWWDQCGLPGCPYFEVVCRSRAMTQAMDHEIGRLLDHIDDSDTAVIFFGDNGTEAIATAAPFDPNHAKASLFQGGINVPFIATAPGLAAGVNHQLVQLNDLFSTSLELTGVPLPTDVMGMDSVSLAQYLSPAHAAPGAAPREVAFSEIFEPNFEPENGMYPVDYVAEHHHLTLRDDRFKLIERNSLATGRTQQFFRLFDASPGAPPTPHDPADTPDPFEQVDLLLTQGSWSPEIQAAFDALVARLATYDRLPLTTEKEFAPLAVVEATETVTLGSGVIDCGSNQVRVAWAGSEASEFTARAYMDFDLSTLPPLADVVAVELDFELASGFAQPNSRLVIRSLPITAGGADCTALFASSGGLDYGLASGLGSPGLVTVSLNALAANQIEQLLAAGQGDFSIALTYTGEGTSADSLSLNPAPAVHRLRVVHGLKP